MIFTTTIYKWFCRKT